MGSGAALDSVMDRVLPSAEVGCPAHSRTFKTDEPQLLVVHRHNVSVCLNNAQRALTPQLAAGFFN